MKLSIIALSVASVLLFVGCGSKDGAKEVAYEMCELSKIGDVKGMKKYAEPEYVKILDGIEQMLEEALKNDVLKKEFEKSLTLFKDINCKETTIITDISDTKKQVSNARTSQVYFLTLTDGKWILTIK